MKSVLFSPCSMYILFLFVARLPGKHSIVRNSFQLQFHTNIQFIKSSHFERILKHVCFYTLWQGLAVGEIIKSFIIFQCDTKRIIFDKSFQCISMSGLSDWSNRCVVRFEWSFRQNEVNAVKSYCPCHQPINQLKI